MHMSSTTCYMAVVVCVLLSVTHATAYKFESGIVHEDVARVINIGSHLETVMEHFEVENTGSTSVTDYLVTVPADKAKALSYVQFDTRREGEEVELVGTRVTSAEVENWPADVELPVDAVMYGITFKTPLKPGDKIKVQVISCYMHVLKPLPEVISNSEHQKVVYFGNHYSYTPYPSTSQNTKLVLGSDRIESRSRKRPSKVSGESVTYGPFEDVKPLSQSSLNIHYQFDKPFVTAHHCSKEIEISHWGNVAVEEHYLMANTGASLRGEWSRHDYQRSPGHNSYNAFNLLRGRIPKLAKEVYYRDAIGNVTTSRLRRDRQHTSFEVTPRYPMVGGWKSDFFIGYNLPSQSALYQNKDDPSQFVLELDFGSPFPEVVIDNLKIRVAMPEGATDIKFAVPYELDSYELTSHKTYLDTTGRPALVIEKSNVVAMHNTKKLRITYRYSGAAIYREPLMLVSIFFSFFVIAMMYMRVNLSLGH
jgi:dolichyl-diphosphooligosaccharide---protein glycosyltransferase subunit 1 (ribophorin I)